MRFLPVSLHTLVLNDFAGYDTGVVSGALVTIGGDLGPSELSDTQKVFITPFIGSSSAIILVLGIHHLCDDPGSPFGWLSRGSTV